MNNSERILLYGHAAQIAELRGGSTTIQEVIDEIVDYWRDQGTDILADAPETEQETESVGFDFCSALVHCGCTPENARAIEEAAVKRGHVRTTGTFTFLCNEIAKSGHSFPEVTAFMASRGWDTFQASWNTDIAHRDGRKRDAPRPRMTTEFDKEDKNRPQ